LRWRGKSAQGFCVVRDYDVTDRYFLLVTHGDPTSLSISPAALFSGSLAFAAAFLHDLPSTLIARYGTLPIVGWSMLIAGLMLTPFYAGRGTTFVIDGSLLLAFFYLVVIGTALTFSLYLKGADDWRAEGEHSELRRAAEQRVAVGYLLGVAFTLPDWLGTLLIVSSVVLISMDSRRRVKTSGSLMPSPTLSHGRGRKPLLRLHL
jgi:predicted neutral ceramidase superfamily lipid hydrolase